MSVNRTWAVVPLKAPETAKSRLAPEWCATDRRHLFFSMARHVIETLQGTAGIARIGIVTASDEVASFSRRWGAHIIRQDADQGTAAAFAAAIDFLRQERFERLLMISGDLPLLSSAAVQEMMAAIGASPSVVVAPDRDRSGTNALLCAPPEAIPPLFGENSFNRHQRFAEQSGIPCRIVDRVELALDLDVAADVDFLRARGLSPAMRGRDAAHRNNPWIPEAACRP